MIRKTRKIFRKFNDLDEFKFFIKMYWSMFTDRSDVPVININLGKDCHTPLEILKSKLDIFLFVLYRFVIQNDKQCLLYYICYWDKKNNIVNIHQIAYGMNEEFIKIHTNINQVEKLKKFSHYAVEKDKNDLFLFFEKFTKENKIPNNWYVMNDSKKVYYDDYFVNEEFSFDSFIKTHKKLSEIIKEKNNSWTALIHKIIGFEVPGKNYRK